jgi:lia operon protein LiaF
VSKHKKTDFVSMMTIAAIVLLLIEITFFNSGVIFSGLLSGICIYFGRRKLPSTLGKILFWFGLVILFITTMTMITVKFLLIAILLFFIVQYLKSKQDPVKIRPTFEEHISVVNDMPEVNKQPLFQNILFGKQQTPDHVYEWNDVNIQTGVGDTVIDLSNTVLPKGVSIISIRNFIGNITVLVPYEMEVSVNHSVLYGSTTIFEYENMKEINQSLAYFTPQYNGAEQKIKIVTSLLIGDLEVKRV